MTPTIAEMMRDVRATVAEANLPVGLTLAFRAFAIRLDAREPGPRHHCGHLFESHGKAGCALCKCPFLLAELCVPDSTEVGP